MEIGVNKFDEPEDTPHSSIMRYDELTVNLSPPISTNLSQSHAMVTQEVG